MHILNATDTQDLFPYLFKRHLQHSVRMSVPTVSIVGGGPAGLLLARFLQLHEVSCAVYENEASVNARTQGGSLDLHEETGLKALKMTGLLAGARKLMRGKAAEAMKIMDKDGKVWWDENVNQTADVESSKGDRPELDR